MVPSLALNHVTVQRRIAQRLSMLRTRWLTECTAAFVSLTLGKLVTAEIGGREMNLTEITITASIENVVQLSLTPPFRRIIPES